MNNMEGPGLLKEKYQLHNTPEVKGAAKRTETRTGEKVPQKPEARIQNYLDRFSEIIKRADPKLREAGVNAFKQVLYDRVVIKEDDVPDSFFELQKRLAREQGHGDIAITDEARRQHIDVIQSDQRSTLDLWIDYFASPDSSSFPDWAKYWAFRGMLTMGKYDKEKRAFGTRTKQTVAPFPDLDRESLSYTVDYIQKKAQGVPLENPLKEGFNPFAEEAKKVSDEDFQKLIETESFAKYYAFAIEHMVKDNTELFAETRGQWRVFPQGSDAQELIKTLQGHGTGWCTAGESTAAEQLKHGDFLVYYSVNNMGVPTIPRLAIRMEGESIAEVRGVADQQNIDQHITPVLEEKMHEFGEEGQAYRKRVADMAQLTEISRMQDAKEALSQEQLRFLYEMDYAIEGFGYRRDPRIEELKSQRNWKEDMQLIFNTNDDNELARVLIEEDKGESVTDNFEKFQGLDHTAIAKLLIEKGAGWPVADNLEKFEGLDHDEIAQLLIEKAGGASVAANLEKFQGLTAETAKLLVEKGKGESVAVAYNLEKFEGLDHTAIAKLLIEKGAGESVIKNLEKFQGLTAETLQKLKNAR